MIATRFLVLLLIPAVLAQVPEPEVPESPRKDIGGDWANKAMQFWDKVKNGKVWNSVKHYYNASGLANLVKIHFPNVQEKLKELATQVKESFNDVLDGAETIYDIATDSYKDVKEGYEDCQKVDGEVDITKCVTRIFNNVQDLVDCNNVTYELSFEVQCTDDMDARKKDIKERFEEEYVADEVSGVSVRFLNPESCTSAASTPAEDASTPAEDASTPAEDTVQTMARRLEDNGKYVRVEVEVDVDVSDVRGENQKQAFEERTKAIKTKLEELGAWEDAEHDGNLPEWFKTNLSYAKQEPVLLSPELSVCEIVDAAQFELADAKKQYAAVKDKVDELKAAVKEDEVKSKIQAWFKRVWNQVKGMFASVKSELQEKLAELKALKEKMAGLLDASQEAAKKAISGNSDNKPSPGAAKSLRRLRKVRMLSSGVQAKTILV